MDNNNGNRLSINTSIDCVDGSVTASASASGQNGNIEVFEPEELVVSTLEDENDGNFSEGDLSLREAIALANEREGADLITFDDSLNGGTIFLTETEADPRGLGTINQDLSIADSVQIDGLGANNLTIDGVNGGGGIFHIEGNNTNVTLTNLNIVNGDRLQFFSQNPTFGGAILVNDSDGSLNLQDSVISDSSASYAGAISSNGDVNIFGSLIENNASGSGGEFQAGAIRVSSSGNLSILNSTVANNSNRGIISTGSTEISNSTILDGVQGNDLTLTSSIVLNDSDSSAASIEGNFTITSDGNNLVGNGNNLDGFVDSDLVGTTDNPIDPQLGELQDNGGLTKTLALQEGSPAIDAGSNPSNLTFDQRGLGFNRTIGNDTDIGAYEVQDNGGGQMNEELVVSTIEDENDGNFGEGDLSLREAIALANEREGADTISFDNSLNGNAIALDTSLENDLIISDSLSINGLGQDNLTLDGSFFWQITEPDINVVINGLSINGGKIDNLGNLTFSNSTIANSFSIGPEGSSIISRGALNISNSTITDNNGAQNTGVLIESGTASINDSTIANNTAIDVGLTGIIIRNDAIVDISNTTIANNDSRANAGVINSGIVNVTNSTIVNNNGGMGTGGIDNFGDGVATVTSTIVANNTGSGDGPVGDISGGGEFISGGNNLIGNGDDAEGFVDGVNGDLVGSDGNDPNNPQTELLIDPQLGELQNNGGATETLALLEGSPAIDAGSNPNNLATDQRGEGFDRTVGSSADIGAYEVQNSDNGEIPDELVVSTLEDENDGDYSQGDLSLREAIALSNEREGADTITFDSNLTGKIVLSQGELTIADAVTIDGNNGQNLTVDGNNSDRIFKIDDGNSETNADVTLDGLYIENGNVDNRETDNTGGGILNRENLTVIRSTISYNSAEQGGGIANQGNLTLQSSYIDNNYAFEAGGIYTIAGNNQIIDSSINNNESNFNSGGILVDNATIDIENSLIDGNSTGAAYGGISINSSTANINNSTIAYNDGGGNAGGISSSSSVTTINNSTIVGNTAAANGGIIAGSSGDGNEAVVTINNSTITGNSATVNQGGGVKNYINSTMNINNSTITGNFAAQGVAGVYQQESFIAPDDLPEDVIISGTLNLNSSIVAGNENNQDLGGDSFNSGGNNLIGNGDGFEDYFNESLGDLVGTANNPIDPRLGELQENGGLTQTIALLEDSPAIDAGNNSNNFATDQRGEGFDRTVGDGTDIGAYEVQTLSSNNDIVGTENNDFLQGTAENDRIFGLGSADFIEGLDGNDFLSGGDGNDYLKGGNSSDTVEGDAGNDLIEGGAGFDILRGGDGHDRLIGGAEVDTIDDGAGNDVVFGGNGEDRFLASNPGHDLFTGGSGNDIYVYNINPDAGFFDRDRILDFSQSEDTIAFRPFVSDFAAFDEFADLDTNGSGVLDSDDERIHIRGISTVIDFSDLFGRSHDSDTITLVGVTNLDESNFLFNETVVSTEFG